MIVTVSTEICRQREIRRRKVDEAHRDHQPDDPDHHQGPEPVACISTTEIVATSSSIQPTQTTGGIGIMPRVCTGMPPPRTRDRPEITVVTTKIAR
jgi:hypothetical protein